MLVRKKAGTSLVVGVVEGVGHSMGVGMQLGMGVDVLVLASSRTLVGMLVQLGQVLLGVQVVPLVP